MKRLLKIAFAVLLCAVFALVLASCEEAEGGKDVRADEEYLDDLPDDLDFEGETINVFYWGQDFLRNELTADGSTGDIVDLAVAQRNVSVEDRLNVHMNYIEGDIAAEYFMPIARDEILSGSQDYDVIIGPYYEACKAAQEGVFQDLARAKYIDYSKDYWNEDYIGALTINNKKYMVVGDISLSQVKSCAMMLVDSQRYEDTFGPLDGLYDLVFEGDGAAGGWTYDMLDDYARRSYIDLNGNGLRDNSDQFGVTVGGGSSMIDVMVYSSGVNFSHRDERNLPVLDLDSKKTYDFVDRFYRLFWENPGSYVDVRDYTTDEEDVLCVFGLATMQSLVDLRGETRDFGVIPMPKYDENDTSYHAWTGPYTFSVPITLGQDRVDMITAVLECMGSEGRRLCVPAYYEIALKDKYTRDDTSVKMLDIIHDGATTDFISVYSNTIGDIGSFMIPLIRYQEPDFVSWYAARKTLVEAKLADLLEAYGVKQ